MGKPKKYAAVSGAKKDFPTVAKIARSDHPRFAFTLMARFDALQTTKFTLRLR
jgi:hypothetical protein